MNTNRDFCFNSIGLLVMLMVWMHIVSRDWICSCINIWRKVCNEEGIYLYFFRFYGPEKNNWPFGEDFKLRLFMSSSSLFWFFTWCPIPQVYTLVPISNVVGDCMMISLWKFPVLLIELLPVVLLCSLNFLNIELNIKIMYNYLIEYLFIINSKSLNHVITHHLNIQLDA